MTVLAVASRDDLGGGINDLQARDGIESKSSQEAVCVGIHINSGDSQSRDLGNVLIFSLSLLFLEFEGDATDGSTLNTFHQVSRESSNLVSQTLGGDDGHLITELLVGVEVQSETGVVLFNQDPGGFFDRFCSNSTLFGDMDFFMSFWFKFVG